MVGTQSMQHVAGNGGSTVAKRANAGIDRRFQRLQFLLRHFDCEALHDQIEGEYDAQTILDTDDGAIVACQSAGTNSDALSRSEVGMRLRSAMTHSGAKRFDLLFRDRCRFTIQAADNRDDPGHLQHSNPFAVTDVDKKVAGKERKIDICPRTVIPSAMGAIEWQEMRDLSQLKVLRHALFVAVSGVYGKPLPG